MTASFNVNDTMDSIRYLMKKYEWMASDVQNKGVLKKDKDLPPQTEMTDEEMDMMADLYKEGMEVKHIAAQMKRSCPSVYWALKDRGVFKGKVQKKYSKEFKAKAVADFKSGMKIQKVADKHKVSYKAVKKWIENENQK